jgi:hypothetical protein
VYGKKGSADYFLGASRTVPIVRRCMYVGGNSLVKARNFAQNPLVFAARLSLVTDSIKDKY